MGYGLCILIGAVLGGVLVGVAFGIKARKIIEDLRGRLAVAEEKNFRIPKLELTIAENKSQIAELTGRVDVLKEDILQKADRIATLNLQLVEQTQASKNKLAMVNDAQSKLCQALIALSEAALNCDNDEFIKAMESNLGAFEESLLADISRWQGRKRTAASEICQIADSEQVAPPLPPHDEKLEELIAPKEPAEETVAESEPPAEQPDDITPAPAESPAESAQDSEVADSDTDDTRPDDEEPVQSEVILQSAEADTSAPGDTEDTEEEDLITLRTEAEVASLAQRLDEEIAFEFGDTDNDDDSDAISPADAPAESPLRLEIEETPPPAQGGGELTLKDEDANENPLKKKLNSQSAPPQARKKAV